MVGDYSTGGGLPGGGDDRGGWVTFGIWVGNLEEIANFRGFI
jgi:hypothetical protein